MHENKGELPDCENCIPPLIPDNEDAFQVYQQTHSQYILSGMGGPVDINHLPVWEYIDRYEIEDPLGCFEIVVAVSRHMINAMNEEAKAERGTK